MFAYKNLDPNWIKKVVCKDGVTLDKLRPEILKALEVAVYVYATFGQKLVVTSANDGKHMKNSLHYKDLAFDLRTRDIEPKIVEEMVAVIKKNLTADYDVIIETISPHLHIEFDVKGVKTT